MKYDFNMIRNYPTAMLVGTISLTVSLKPKVTFTPEAAAGNSYICRLMYSKNLQLAVLGFISKITFFFIGLFFLLGTAVAQCATNRKVAGSIPDGVIGIFR
jgi:hypothetical protein